MPHIRPFRAWRYDDLACGEAAGNFSPLFDVVSPDQLEELYQSPCNSIHLSVPQTDDSALQKLQEWKSRGILRQDPLPGIYVYYQEFSLFGEDKKYVRKGFISLVRMQQPGQNSGTEIIQHEGTLSASVAERTRLLEKTLLNTAPTHGLYEDPEFELEKIMDLYMEHPVYQYIDYQGVINKMAVIQDRRDILRFQSSLACKKVYLADGHHRLGSSIALRDKWLTEGKSLPEDSFVHYHMMYLTNLCGDDLRILPIHRLFFLKDGTRNPNPILARLREYFEVEDITFDRTPIYNAVQSHHHAFGMVMGSLQFLLKLRADVDPVALNDLPLPSVIKELDYTILHYFVFDKCLGLSYEVQHASDAIKYLKDYGLAVKQAVTWPDRIAFITPGTQMDQMLRVCETGQLMPQKSTYFYPKVVCGMAFASIDDNENNSPFDFGFGVTSSTTTTS
jgi:uncharacterized protein (DUF1015 family)